MKHSNRRYILIYNKLFPQKVKVNINDIYQCIEEEMKKDDSIIDDGLIDFCINVIDEFNKESNNIITECEKKESFKKILYLIL